MSVIIINPYVFTFDPDVQAWLDRGTALGYVLPSTTVQIALSDFVKSLKLNGLFTRMKTGYIMHAGSAQMGTLNLRNPLTYQSTLVNSPTFSEGNGMKSNGTTSYIDQPFKSNEYAGIESDLTGIQYISESSTVNAGMVSSGFGINAAGSLFWLIRPLLNATSSDFWHYSASTSFANTNHKSLYVLTRPAAGSQVIYNNGVKTTGAVAANVPNISINRFILAANGATANGGLTPANYYTKFVAADFLFDRFSDTDESNFRTPFNTYKTAAGLP